jgi:hypothetical protein
LVLALVIIDVAHVQALVDLFLLSKFSVSSLDVREDVFMSEALLVALVQWFSLELSFELLFVVEVELLFRFAAGPFDLERLGDAQDTGLSLLFHRCFAKRPIFLLSLQLPLRINRSNPSLFV